MFEQVKRSGYSNISPSLFLKRASTTTSATDSSTASSAGDAGPDSSRTPQRKTRQQDESQPRQRVNCDGSSIDCSAIKRNRKRRSIPTRVSFGAVAVRVYSRSIGDWWDVQYGLCLGWEYEDMPAVPLPDDNNEGRTNKSKVKKMIQKIKSKWIGWMLVARYKRNSLDITRADTVLILERKTDKCRIRTKSRERRRAKKEKSIRRLLTYEDSKPSPEVRRKLLQDFGFLSNQLDTSEAERKLLRFEYSHWTRESKTHSLLFTQRCLADFKAIDAGVAPFTSSIEVM